MLVTLASATVGYLPLTGTARNEVADAGRLTVFVGAGFAITVSYGDPGAAKTIRRRLDEQPELLAEGPSAVLYVTADAVVDHCVDAAERFEADLTEIEASVFAEAGSNQAERIHRAKRELLKLRRAIVPLGQPVRALTQQSPELVPAKIQACVRDVSDHLDRLHSQHAGCDEIINSMLQANLAQLSVSQNNDMRKITSRAAIIAVPTAIAGIYGMNFTDMPELHWSLGYPAVLTMMAVVCVVLYRNFKRREWL